MLKMKAAFLYRSGESTFVNQNWRKLGAKPPCPQRYQRPGLNESNEFLAKGETHVPSIFQFLWQNNQVGSQMLDMGWRLHTWPFRLASALLKPTRLFFSFLALEEAWLWGVYICTPRRSTSGEKKRPSIPCQILLWRHSSTAEYRPRLSSWSYA